MGIRERRPDATSVVLAAGTAQAGEEQRLHQKHKAPPDMKTGQSAMTCLRREVPTDHEARSHTHAGGTAAGREPRLSGSAGLQPGSRTKVNTKHDRIHTQALGENGPKMDGDASVTRPRDVNEVAVEAVDTEKKGKSGPTAGVRRADLQLVKEQPHRERADLQVVRRALPTAGKN